MGNCSSDNKSVLEPNTTDKPTVAIMTGNSNSGSSCIKELFERYPDKVNVRGVFRSADKAKSLKAKYPKLQIVADVDASKPETLKKAFQGAQTAVIVTPHDATKGFQDDANLTANMINAAVDNGVKYIIYVGSFTVNFPNKIKIISSRFIPSEQLLQKLGREKNIHWTSLRGGFFMENFYMFKDSIKKDSSFQFPNVYVPPVDTRDIGKAAAACIVDSHDKHHQKFYEICGPEVLSSQDIAKIFSRVLGREIKWIELKKDAVTKMPAAFAEIYLHFLEAGKNAVPYKDDVKKLTGQWGTLEQFLKDHIKDFQ